ncbi:MAG: hypothetical protein SF052_05500 [Bacteroidia bacterium]|nr:hypothetical protein [Bacteroidia bacterium]
MLIANPIYDVVFKYLLDDPEIARELLSTILGLPITALEVKPQETLVQGGGGEIKIFHLDFKALVKQADGSSKMVLIELQKAKKSYDIMRFRCYLGENYTREEFSKNEKGETESQVVEIVSIYILGFKLEGVEVPVLKVSRRYEDAITHQEVRVENEFIRKLTHESFTIQIPRLEHRQRNQLEEVLEIFSQDFLTDDLHTLNYEKSPKNALVNRILRRLKKAAADEEIRKKMDAEDSMDRILHRELKTLSEQLQASEEKLQASEEKLQTIEQEKAELQKKLEEALRQLKKE